MKRIAVEGLVPAQPGPSKLREIPGFDLAIDSLLMRAIVNHCVPVRL